MNRMMLRMPITRRRFGRSGKPSLRAPTACVVALLSFFLLRAILAQFNGAWSELHTLQDPEPIFSRANATALDPPVSLRSYLNFSERTALNFMHLHKTGGVSFKTALYRFFDLKRKRGGKPVQIRDACYARNVSKGVTELQMWACDWNEVWAQPEAVRNQLDVVFGHQYRLHGVDGFLNKRDVRTFAVLRHPLAKKVSFYFHFFVREQKRAEKSVHLSEIRDFLLQDKANGSLGQDSGPNYIAGHFLSDGVEGFAGTYMHRFFEVLPEHRKAVTEKAMAVLRSYVFIGLQTRPKASMCLLRKTVEHFCDALGIDCHKAKEIEANSYRQRYNTGSYGLSADKIWASLTEEEKAVFNEREQVDLALYDEGVRLFNKQINLFGCHHIVN